MSEVKTWSARYNPNSNDQGINGPPLKQGQHLVLKSDYDDLKSKLDATNKELGLNIVSYNEIRRKNEELMSELAKANKLIKEFDPDDCFTFEKGSEELEESVREYLKGEG